MLVGAASRPIGEISDPRTAASLGWPALPSPQANLQQLQGRGRRSRRAEKIEYILALKDLNIVLLKLGALRTGRDTCWRKLSVIVKATRYMVALPRRLGYGMLQPQSLQKHA